MLIQRLCVVCGLCFSLTYVAVVRSAEPAMMVKTAKPITVDGVLDDPVWKQAAAVDANYVMGEVGKSNPEKPLSVQYAWDGDYLYIAYETFDKNLIALASDKVEGPKDQPRQGCEIWHATEKVDVVEFFISFGDERFFWEIHHNAANQFNDVWCAVYDPTWPISKSSYTQFGIHFGFSATLEDDVDGAKTVATAVKLKGSSTINDAAQADSGYTAEIRIPWFSLGAPTASVSKVTVSADGKPKSVHGPWKMAGQELMILAVAQDGDLEQRYHHSSATLPGGWFHKTASHWPKYVPKE